MHKVMNIAATVILYYPTDNAFENIEFLSKHFTKVFVYDNTISETTIQNKIEKLTNVKFYKNFKNEGVAKRLNQAAKIAIEQGFDWLLTMDQDSCFTEKELKKYIDLFKLYNDKESVAMFGCNYAQNNPKAISKKIDSEETDILITSGSLLNLKVYKHVGSFDENYFIDHVDNDYCIRAKLAGYKLILFYNINLSHTLGDFKKRRSFKTLYLIPKQKTVHGPLRCYYMKRNMLYLEKKFIASNVPLITLLKKNLDNYIKQCLFYNGNFWSTLKFQKLAKQDFEKGIMGKKELF
jgi:rhamnosyltransferase